MTRGTKAPFLSKSELTGKWWLVTSYTEDARGNRVARTKWDMDAAIGRIQAEALRHFARDVPPNDNYCSEWERGYNEALREALRRADRIEGEATS